MKGASHCFYMCCDVLLFYQDMLLRTYERKNGENKGQASKLGKFKTFLFQLVHRLVLADECR
jgi:hypothetical protein